MTLTTQPRKIFIKKLIRKSNLSLIPPPSKPKVKKLIRKKKVLQTPTLDNLSNDLLDDDLEEVLVKNWKCNHNNTNYLIDPITQEVYDKLTRSLLGVRYRNEDDEISLIDFF